MSERKRQRWRVDGAASRDLGLQIGKRICERRTDLGWTQQDLASKLRMTSEQIAGAERGEYRLSPAELCNAANLMAVRVSFFFQEGTPNPLGDYPLADSSGQQSAGAPAAPMLAVIEASSAPLLLLDADLRIVSNSTSFCAALQIDPARIVGRRLFELGAGEWQIPEFQRLLRATAAGYEDMESYAMDLCRSGGKTRHLVVTARKLVSGGRSDIRVLLTIVDATELDAAAKVNDGLAHDKTFLLQELQHRIANSLQIIAGLLLQSARSVQSDETRVHLQDAHQRVMSVAALQQQLAKSTSDDVDVQPYLGELCRSIDASMIRYRDQVALEVSADSCVVRADVCVSFGLIVTELVINALKHAFPDGRQGKISVTYRAVGPDWILSVEDDGAGMAAPANARPSGLGTSIVKALAEQLQARVDVASGPGTRVSIVPHQIAGTELPARALEPVA